MEVAREHAVNVIQMPGRGLNHIDLRVVEFAGRFLGWDVEIAWTPEHEAFAILGSTAIEDVVYVLTKEPRGYILTEFPPDTDVPLVHATGSLQKVFETLPQAREYQEVYNRPA